MDIGTMFSAVRADVLKATNNKQIPLVQMGLSRPLHLGGSPGGGPDPIPEPPPEDTQPVVSLSEDTEFWLAIKDTSDPKNYEQYLERYPRGRYAVLVRRKLDDLLRSQKQRPQRTSPEVGPAEDEPVSSIATAHVTADHPRAEAVRSARTLARARAIAGKLPPGGASLPTLVSSSSDAAELLRYVARGVTVDEVWTELPGSSKEIRLELRARVHVFPPLRGIMTGELASTSVVADQPIRIKLTTRKDAEIGMFAWQADGSVLRLFPAPSQSAVRIRAGETVTFPRANDPYPAISSGNMPGERSNHEAIVIVTGTRQTIPFERIAPTAIAETMQHGTERQLDSAEFMRRLANIADPDLEVLVLPYVVRAAR